MRIWFHDFFGFAFHRMIPALGFKSRFWEIGLNWLRYFFFRFVFTIDFFLFHSFYRVISVLCVRWQVLWVNLVWLRINLFFFFLTYLLLLPIFYYTIELTDVIESNRVNNLIIRFLFFKIIVVIYVFFLHWKIIWSRIVSATNLVKVCLRVW